MTGFYTAALSYARLGLPVLPCTPRGKAPLTEHGFRDATTDPKVLRDWALKWLDPNLGIRTGVECNGKMLVVIDVDPRNDGEDTLAQLIRQYGTLPDTAMVLTGGGGQHYYFWCPADVNLRAIMGPGIDLKSRGGYVVAPPSIHPSGKSYLWEASSDLLEDAAIADLPAWVVEHFSKLPAPPHDPDSVSKDEVSEAELLEIWDGLEVIPASVGRATWIEVLMALHSRSSSEQMYELADAWSQRCPEKYDAVALRKAWDSLKPNGGITIKTLGLIADQYRFNFPEELTNHIDISGLLHKESPAPENVDAPAPSSMVPSDDADDDRHTNQPKPDPAMLYGLAGDVGRAAAATTEANEYAVAAAYLAYLSAMVGRDVYLPVGNTWHHARIFTLHVGRSGRGRKGDALSLVHRIRDAVKKRTLLTPIGQVHTGGLSTREGLALMIHDGYTLGKEEVAPIRDKRLWVVESEFANILHQSKRDGNTLSSALRDAWDGVSIRPAVKSSRVWATNPHIGMSGAITPSEFKSVIQSRELTNGFANRYFIYWAERKRLIEFPQATRQEVVDELAKRTLDAIRFAAGNYPDTQDSRPMSLSAEASALYGELYRGELNRQSDGDLVDALLERRAPTLLRLAMLFAITDQTLQIEKHHIATAWAWVRYWRDSVRFIFGGLDNEDEVDERVTNANQILDFLKVKKQADKTELHRDCFRNRLRKEKLDSALDYLLQASPPTIEVERQPRKDGQPGRGRKVYRRLDVEVREVREVREVSGPKTVRQSSPKNGISEVSELLDLNSQNSHSAKTTEPSHSSLSSQNPPNSSSLEKEEA